MFRSTTPTTSATPPHRPAGTTTTTTAGRAVAVAARRRGGGTRPRRQSPSAGSTGAGPWEEELPPVSRNDRVLNTYRLACGYFCTAPYLSLDSLFIHWCLRENLYNCKVKSSSQAVPRLFPGVHFDDSERFEVVVTDSGKLRRRNLSNHRQKSDRRNDRDFDDVSAKRKRKWV